MPVKAMNNINIIRFRILGIHFGYSFYQIKVRYPFWLMGPTVLLTYYSARPVSWVSFVAFAVIFCSGGLINETVLYPN